MQEELKPAPCPFCGSAASLEYNFGRDPWVQCTNLECGATDGIEHETGRDAIEFWNRRTPVSGEVAEGVEVDRNAASPAAPAGQHDTDDVTCDQCIELEGALHREYARQAIAGIRKAAVGLTRYEFKNGLEAACEQMEAALNLNDEQSSMAGAAKGGITKTDWSKQESHIVTVPNEISAQGIDHAKLDERTAFEAWLKGSGSEITDCTIWDGIYLYKDIEQAWRGWQARGQQAGGAEDAAETSNNPSLLRVMGGAMTGFSMAFPASPFDFVPPSRVTPEWVGWKVADTGWLPIDDDAAILKLSLDALTAHFDEFIGECMAGGPSAKALARARACLPAKCVNAFKKEKP